MEFFYVIFRKKLFIFGFNNFIFEKTQKYLWKRFYTVKKPLKNRADVYHFVYPTVDKKNLDSRQKRDTIRSNITSACETFKNAASTSRSEMKLYNYSCEDDSLLVNRRTKPSL